MATPTPGSKAPLDIIVLDEHGDEFSLGNLLGTWVVLYCYPKDNTPGCTLEAEEFRDLESDFAARGARVLGISTDSCASHQKFIQKRNLGFTLLSDPEHVLLSALGVWDKRTIMGKTSVGVVRTTFLIDPAGTITFVWENVTPLGHASAVLQELVRIQDEQ